jgi:hypothetical protein
MRFWSREVSGWFLIGIGLYTFFLCYQFLLRGRIWEAGPLTIIGIFLFRGGIHLVKVALAARICLDAQEKQKEKRPPRVAPVGVRRGAPIVGIPRQS